MGWYEHYIMFCDHIILDSDIDAESPSFDWILVDTDADEDIVSDRYRIACKTLDHLETVDARAYHLCRTMKGFVIAPYDLAERLGF